MPRRPLRARPPRALALALTLALGAGVGGCKKSSDGGSAAPGAGGASASATDGVALRYKSGAFKLKQDARISVTMSGGGQSGSFAVDAVGLLDVSDQGGKLKVAHSVVEVRDVKMEGALKPEPKDGKAPPDPKAELLKATGATLIDLRGAPDAEGTTALAENKKDGPKGDFDDLGDFLGLPQLPEPTLTLGKPVKQEKREEQTIGGSLKIPTDEESTYTLLKVEEVGGRRLAEVKIESESSGAVEAQGGMISIDSVAEGVIVFDLATQLPVRVHIEQTQTFAFGNQGGGESRVVIDATFEPA